VVLAWLLLLSSFVLLILAVFFSCPVDHLDLHSFPTRRSSDLRTRSSTGWSATRRVTPSAFRTSTCARTWSPASTSRRPSPTSWPDRKSTRLNSSHVASSYAGFCLKKKKSRRSRCHRGRDAQSR